MERGDFVRAGFVLGGYCPGGICPGGYCSGGYCPRTSRKNITKYKARMKEVKWNGMMIRMMMMIITLMRTFVRTIMM